jgi:hypothetical protein
MDKKIKFIIHILDIVFKSIKMVNQLARFNLDNRTSVRYNKQVAILERVRMEGYGNG